MMHIAFMVNPTNFGLAPLLINISTLSKIHHSELLFTDGVVLTSDPEGGVYYTRNTYNRFHWVVIPLPWIDQHAEKSIRQWADAVVATNKGYDWRGAVFGRFFLRFQHPDKWFCSEVCAEAIRPHTSAIKEGVWYSPHLLWKCLSNYLDEYDPKYSEVWKFRYRKTS